MIKNYIFDFGNVLGRFDPKAMTAACISDPEIANTIYPVAYDRLYWDRLDAGTITDEELHMHFFQRLPRELAQAAWKAYEGWISAMPPIEGMQALVRDIKSQGSRIFLLSNISKGFAENYQSCPWIGELLDQFDGLVFSAVVGLVKPQKKIFTYLLNTYNLKAEECIFIDDREENTRAGEGVGIRGYVFDGDAEKLRKYLHIPLSCETAP